MKIAYFDCFSGISGDMCLGALLEAGLKLKYLEKELSKLGLAGYTLKARKVIKNGLAGTKLDVVVKNESEHLPYEKMVSLIKQSTLSEEVKTKSQDILKRIAEAEAKVHQLSTNEVHLHELGELDTIVDVVGTSIGLAALGIEEVYSSALNLGGGKVKTRHGLLPVPAPATAELIKGASAYSSGLEAEMTTPTGAAIITTIAKGFGALPLMEVEAIGYGAGSFDLPAPNLLRIMIGVRQQKYEQDVVTLIETNIDDSNPQIFDYLMERLFEAGALDVYLTPVQMKKNRPGVLLSVLAAQDKVNLLTTIILKETSSIGVRYSQMERKKLPRRTGLIKTKYGYVKVKIVMGTDHKRITPEYEDCKKIAKEKDIPLSEVYRQVTENTKEV